MFNLLRRIILTKKLSRLTRLAIETIYSEEFDLEKCIKKLSEKNKGAPLLYAYIAIQIAATLTEPITKDDIVRVLNQILPPEIDQEKADEINALQKNLAEIYWCKERILFLKANSLVESMNIHIRE